MGVSVFLHSSIQPSIFTFSSCTLLSFRFPPGAISCLSTCFPSISVKRTNAALILGRVRLQLLSSDFVIPICFAICASDSPSLTHRLICSSLSSASHALYLHAAIASHLSFFRVPLSASVPALRSPKLWKLEAWNPPKANIIKRLLTRDLLSSTQTFLYLYIYSDIYRLSYTLLYDTIIA